MGAEAPVNVLAVGYEPGELEGCTVESAQDLLGALARLADGGIDVVLLALELPDGRGAEVVQAVRDRAPSVPVIAIAGEGDDAERAIDAGASDVVPAEGDPELVRRAIRYTTALLRMQAELHRRQVVDETTGLYNARGFEQLATHHLRLADRSRQPVVLVFVRLTGLDELEAASYAEAREQILADTAEVLREAVRASDVIARVGDEAFCVLLTGDAAGAETLVLSRVVEAVAVRNAKAGRAGQLSLSVGSTTYDPEDPMELDEMIAEADRRMRNQPEA